MKIMKLKENFTALLYLAPFLILSLVFIVYPMARGIYNSFFDFRFGATTFVGLDNYVHVFTNNIYALAIRNSLFFVLTVVPALIIFGLLIAGSVYDKHKTYTSSVRIILYIPVVASMVVMSVVWRFILDAQMGLARYFFDILGLPPINLLADAQLTMIILVFIVFTMNIGQAVLLYLASMIGIPKDLSEALSIDGGNRWHLFRYLLIPLSKPTTLFIFITQSAAVLRVFIVIQLLTNGGPNFASTTMMFLLYRDGLIHGNFGTASALGVIMFAITVVLIIIQFRLFKEKEGA